MRLLLPLLLLLMCGCGTLSNLQGKSGCGPMFVGGVEPIRPYGGVRNNIKWIEQGVGLPESGLSWNDSDIPRQVAPIHEDPVGIAMGLPIFGYLSVVDPVLSVVGDTFSLPYTLREYRKHQLNSNERVQLDNAKTSAGNAR